MQLGVIGLGRMGGNITRRLTANGHECVVFDRDAKAVGALAGGKVAGASGLDDLVRRLKVPRAVWVMLPAGRATEETVAALAGVLERDDVIIDGGNSFWQDDIRRAKLVAAKGIHYVDAGTSGGIWGLERGYCLMIGGEEKIVSHLHPIFASLAPGVGSAPPTPGRENGDSTAEQGFLYCGPHGAGHFVKMIHNGIEYGIMEAYAEGFNILRKANIGKRPRPTDAETTPLRNPEYYQYELDLPEIAEVWRRSSVIRSWLLDLTAAALHEDPDLKNFEGRVSDSGETRWTIAAAIDEEVPVPVISAALFGRFESRGDADYADRLLSALRKQFGGHVEKKG